ncbi:MAG: hypothetical protein HFJ84_10955 [Clostridiales bacterium]|jgi:hypothetical protein|nr:hypothetical protein [Clostridiales bacterium]
MLIFLRSLIIDLKRSCLSVSFCLAISLSILIFFLNSMESIQGGMPTLWCYLNGTSLFEDTMPILIPICIFPCAILFLEDWNTQYFRNLIPRTSFFKYSISKIIALILTSLIICFTSRIIFLIVLFVITPLTIEDLPISEQITLFQQHGIGTSILNLYQSPVPNEIKSIFLSSFLVVFTFALFCAFVGLIALNISVLFTNIFVVLGSPIAIYYFILEFFTLLEIPSQWNPILLGQAAIFCNLGGTLNTFLITTSYFIVGFIIIGWIFLWNSRRRIKNG